MKKFTKIAAAVSLALAAGSASAAWIDGNTLGAPSSVAFQISDKTTQQTFVLDLAVGHAGLNYASFQNGTEGAGSALSWDLSALGGSTFSPFAANTASFKWSVVSSYQFDGELGSNLDKAGGLAPFTDPNNAQWGVQTTVHNPVTDLTQQDFAAIQAAADPNVGKVSSWINRLNAPDAAKGEAIASIAPISGTSFYNTWYADLAGLGGNQSFLGAQTADFYGVTNAWLTDLDNTFTKLGTFSLSAGNVLTFNAVPVSAVPVPAAVWLFGSALLGVLGFNRRNRTVIAA